MSAARDYILYRFFAADDRLLYVGMTCNPGQRFERHRGKSWWGDVASIEMEQHPSREALREAERRAIEEELPVHNIRMNGPVSTLHVEAPGVLLNRTHDEPPDKLRRGLEVGGVYALALDDGSCPCGRITSADDEGVVLDLFDWLVGIFGSRGEWIPFDAIRRWTRADLMGEAAKRADGWHASFEVYDMNPLADFQTRWCESQERVEAGWKACQEQLVEELEKVARTWDAAEGEIGAALARIGREALRRRDGEADA